MNFVEHLISDYSKAFDNKHQKLEEFFCGDRPFLVVQQAPLDAEVWGAVNSVDKIVQENLNAFRQLLNFEYTDELPYLEPWVGTGIYAEAFGCEYVWFDNEAPATRYLYNSIDEIENIVYPDWRKSTVMKMCLESIDRFNELSNGRLPICLTDTQSPFDTATLIMDANEFMVSCLSESANAINLLDNITNLIIEFSRVQAERIGEFAWSRPGHIITSKTKGRGISVSDDNLSFCSPEFNSKYSLPFNQKIAEAFDGVAIHSCGSWVHTMDILDQFPGIFMIDFALEGSGDTKPNDAKQVKEKLTGKNIILQARLGQDTDSNLKVIESLINPELKTIVKIGCNQNNPQEHYIRTCRKVAQLYGM